VIHATPLVPALRQAVPGSRIIVVASGFALDVFSNNPGVEMLVETPSPLRNLRAAIRSLRSQPLFDGEPFAVVTSVGNERTKVAAQSFGLDAAPRIGYTTAASLYSAPIAFDRSLSVIANNLRIVEALGYPARHFEPQVFCTEDDRDAARMTLAKNGVVPGQPVAIFVTQTSATQQKGWRVERFQAAASFLSTQYNAHIVFVGTSSESPAIDRIRTGLPFSTTNLAGKTRIPQLAALMSIASIGLTLDTGPMHVGRAVGLPMAIIAPAWSPPIEWLPLDNPRFRILKNLDMPAAPDGYIIDEVSVADVTTALSDLIQHYPLQRRDL
jgi:ADP-heptose:LPS heptosyltransferase